MRTFGAIYPLPPEGDGTPLAPRLNAWLDIWSFRIQSRITPKRPTWLHLRMCPQCRGGMEWLRQQKRAERPS